MARLDFSIKPVAAPEEDAYGPERSTWAQLELRVDDTLLTSHAPHDAFLPASAAIEDAVEGPLCGVAEWMVDNFAEFLWEANVPVPKRSSLEGGGVAIPGLREAAGWWRDVASSANLRAIATWQQRHTLGAAMTQVALPSMVFLPEAERIGLFVTHLPNELNPNVRFRLPENSGEYWLGRDSLRETAIDFVERVLGFASKSEDGHKWAEWLRGRWQGAMARESSAAERRRLRFGRTVADAWDELIEPLGNRKEILEGVLSDIAPIEEAELLDTLLRALPTVARPSNDRRWKQLAQESPLTSGRAYEQGYELARRVRRELKRGSEPIDRVDVLLSEMDIQDTAAESGGLFRTLACLRDRDAAVVVSRDVTGVIPRRVALAETLGRFLFEARGKDWGAAVGEHSRCQETRRAGAFAAELLAPAEAVRRYPDSPERLAEDYGISLGSARWRIHNVFRPPA
jgi:hypothetical protein